MNNCIAKIPFLFIACILLAGCASSVSPKPSGPLKIVIIGDSTVANYPTNIPDRGWGQFIGEYFDGSVAVSNLAKNGRSTKTFINEGLWQKALAEKPNFVLIQFGHNDSHAPQNPEATNAATDFRQYLRQYIDESRAIGAAPILVTPVQRRTYAADGKLDNTLLPYAQAMKAVAAEKNVPLIDLNATSGRLALVQHGTTRFQLAAKIPGHLVQFPFPAFMQHHPAVVGIEWCANRRRPVIPDTTARSENRPGR